MERVWVGVLIVVAVAGVIAGVVLLLDGDEVAIDGTSPTTEATPPDPGGTPTDDVDPGPADAAPPEALDAEVVVDGLESPTYATALPGDDRIFVLERPGRVRIVRDGVLEDEPFLDIAGQVTTRGLEQGLLGVAFHPGYSDNGRFFVHYSAADGGATTLEEYRVSDDPDRADPDSARTVLTEAQPAGNHNGGMLAFGRDGYLWVALGDGGGGGDQFGNGQDPSSRLGTLLRLDIDAEDDGRSYGIPGDNPFADGDGGAPEVWAYGLRNPWRFTFDDGSLYIADVGQNEWEWVNVVPDDEPGLNHGWPITEGSNCFDPPIDCDTEGLVMPVLEYPNAGGDCAIVGGSVYRGEAMPGLHGHYLYSDYCSGWVRSFRYDGEATEARDWSDGLGSLGQVHSFGLDGDGEILVVTADGTLYRLVPA